MWVKKGGDGNSVKHPWGRLAALGLMFCIFEISPLYAQNDPTVPFQADYQMPIRVAQYQLPPSAPEASRAGGSQVQPPPAPPANNDSPLIKRPPAPEVTVFQGVSNLSKPSQAPMYNDSGATLDESVEDPGDAANNPAAPDNALPVNSRHQDAFEASLQNLMPITPEQIEQYRQKTDQREKALADAPPASVGTRTHCVTLAPGFVPPVLQLTPNLITALVLVDESGQPWPITSASLGSGELFTLQVLGIESRNQILLSPMSAHGNSNLVITLLGNDIPLIIRLQTESGLNRNRDIDGMIVFQIQSKGPNAPPPVVAYPVQGPVNDIILTIMDGVMPAGAKLIKTQPVLTDSRFYQLGDTMYLRTRLRLMWPSHTAVLSGVGGYNVYELPVVPSIMVSDDGEVLRVAVKNAQGLDVGSLQ